MEYTIFKRQLNRRLIAFVWRQLLSLYITENVDPQKRGTSHIDDPQCRWNQKEVDCLCWKPEQTRALKCRQKLFSAFFELICLHLHDGHASEKNNQERWRQYELIEEEFANDDLLSCSWKGSVKPFVPVEEDGRVDEGSHDRVSS